MPKPREKIVLLRVTTVAMYATPVGPHVMLSGTDAGEPRCWFLHGGKMDLTINGNSATLEEWWAWAFAHSDRLFLRVIQDVSKPDAQPRFEFMEQPTAGNLIENAAPPPAGDPANN